MQKYEAKKKYLIIYLCLIAVGAFCMMSRWLNTIDPGIILLPGFLLSHITNFALCMMALLIVGFIVLCFGGKLRIISIAALLIAVLGIVYECLLPFLLDFAGVQHRNFTSGSYFPAPPMGFDGSPGCCPGFNARPMAT